MGYAFIGDDPPVNGGGFDEPAGIPIGGGGTFIGGGILIGPPIPIGGGGGGIPKVGGIGGMPKLFGGIGIIFIGDLASSVIMVILTGELSFC